MIIRNIIKQHKSNLKECNNEMKRVSDVHQIISKNHSCNEQGITLVALIVTIIVLLILSGITIASFKQSNIITRAKSSAKRYSASQIDEKIDMAQQNLVAERKGYDYSIKDLVDEVNKENKENKDIDTIFVDESNNGRKATYIIDDYFYDFTKKDDGIIVYNRKADASDKDKEKYKNQNELRGLKSGIITFKNDKTDWTNENVNVTIVAKAEDKSIQEKIDNGTYFVVSTVNDVAKLTTLTKSITSQVATKQGDTIYACLTDGYGTYVATATEKIENIDKTAPTFNATISNLTDTGYDVIITGVTETQSGINRIQCPTWTELNGQDDIDSSWATSTKSQATKQSDNSYKYRVNVTDHNNEYGNYITHVYAYDNVGNVNGVELNSVTVFHAPTVYLSGGSSTFSLSANYLIPGHRYTVHYQYRAAGTGWSSGPYDGEKSFTATSSNYSTTWDMGTTTGTNYYGQTVDGFYYSIGDTAYIIDNSK